MEFVIFYPLPSRTQLLFRFLVADTRLYKPLFCPSVGWSVGRSVGRLVGWSVGWSVGPLFTFLAFLSFLSLRLLPRCPSDLLQHYSCPPTRDLGSRVFGLVLNISNFASQFSRLISCFSFGIILQACMKLSIPSLPNGSN